MKRLAIIIFILCSLHGFSQDRETSTLAKLGQTAPSFNYTDENGEEHNLEEFRGKVVMINFFATWCGPCLQELPRVQSEIHEKYKNNPDFKLLVLGREHSQQEVTEFKEKKGYSFQMLADPKREIYAQFALQFIPRNFIINKKGEIIYSSIGFNNADFEKLKDIISTQLN